MIVDDSELDHLIYRRLFGKVQPDIELVCHYMAEDALDYLRDPASPSPDLIFLDIHMPRMSGFDFLAAIDDEAIQTDSYLVIMTAAVEPEYRQQAAKFELVRQYIEKPLKGEQLSSVLKTIGECA